MPESKEKSTKTTKKKTSSTSRGKTTKAKTTRAKTTAGTKKAPKKPQEKIKEEPKTAEEKIGGEEKFEEEDWGEKLSVIAQKAFDAVKDGVQKLSDFATDSSQVAKIKFEILNLSSDRKSLLREVGEKLWRLHKQNSIGNIEEKFKIEFDKLANFEKKIAAKEKEVDAVSKKQP